ncbi:MAG TPA: hypothetical protein DEQ14_07580 [Treponema sp.]|nr:hypothetical protein [Treponema sp.]
MKIALINGSPKAGKSNSDWFLEKLAERLGKEHEIARYNIAKQPITDYRELYQMEAIIFAFPLYIDAIPSRLFKMMIEMEQCKSCSNEKAPIVYAIINNGFYEGRQNHIALDIIKNWCARAGLHYGQGIGQGAGEMMGFVDYVPLGHGPLKNLGKALNTLTQNIEACKGGEDILFSPNWPRFAWRYMATHYFWHKMAKDNGLKIRDIKKRTGR